MLRQPWLVVGLSMLCALVCVSPRLNSFGTLEQLEDFFVSRELWGIFAVFAILRYPLLRLPQWRRWIAYLGLVIVAALATFRFGLGSYRAGDITEWGLADLAVGIWVIPSLTFTVMRAWTAMRAAHYICLLPSEAIWITMFVHYVQGPLLLMTGRIIV